MKLLTSINYPVGTKEKNNNKYKLELCRAHTPRAHCVIYRVAFVHVHGYNFVIVNFRKLVEVLLNYILCSYWRSR